MNKIKLLLVILTLSITASFAQDVATPEVETIRQKNERDRQMDGAVPAYLGKAF